MVSRRLIESYQKRSTKTLILHTSNHSFISSPWRVGDKDRHQIFVSPTTTSQGSNLYRGKQGHVFPLRIRESSIELQDIIGLCTPLPGTCRGGKIVNTVHHIVSQLSGVFDLRRFIELVDQEKWDEDAASFMALRQTLLTTLISTDKGLDIQSSRYDRIVVDLTDPILSTTGLDTALFNIILREFVTTRTTETRLIVVNNAQEYLRRDSLLSKSLLDLARIGEISNSLLINTLELLTIDPMFISLSDYIIRGHPNPRSWVEHCLLHAPSDMSISHEPRLRPGQITISSGDFNTTSLMYPNAQTRPTGSYSTIMDILELETHSCQENLPLPSEVTELRKEEVVPRIMSSEDFETKPDQGRLPYDTIADFDLNSSVMHPLDVMEGSIPLNEDLNQEAFIETSHIVRNEDTFEQHHERRIVRPSGDMDQSNPILLLVDLMNNHPQLCPILRNLRHW
ncbi:hypothetical protein CPB86DRAFT_451298 [Serendipita vermifera]|nr:hypothetical protein CPB86DRAFT_451298 [Serendipita vermifera]